LVVDNEHIDQLIARYLAGEASPEEAVLLDDWVEQSADNKRYFDQLRLLFNQGRGVSATPVFNVDAAWSTVAAGMREKPIAKVVPLYRRGWAQLAASLLLLVGLPLWLFFGYFKSVSVTSYAAANQIETLQLKDSSKVVLNRHSSLSYTAAFGKSKRKVTLKGEAFFTVQHRSNKPFVVEANGTLVEDIGTAFNVIAYDSTSTVEVYVESGSVRFYTPQGDGITLVAGETGIYNKRTKTFSRSGTANPNVTAYKTKRFVFVDTPLRVVVRELSSVYGVDIALKTSAIENCKITVTFDNEKLESAMEVIAETLNLNVTKLDNSYTLEGTGCENE